jgi:hypothetical protein
VRDRRGIGAIRAPSLHLEVPMSESTLAMPRHDVSEMPSRVWKVAGALGLTHVVLILAALALQSHALFEEGRSGIAAYVAGDLTRTVIGGYVDLLAFLVLIPMLVILSRGIGRRTEVGRVAAVSALLAGAGYVILTFSPGLAAGATSMLGAQAGADLDATWLMNNLRIVTFVLSLVLLGAHAVGLAVAARADSPEGPGSRLIGVGGFVVGGALLACPALLAAGAQDLPVLLWMGWWVALSVHLLRRTGR